MTRRIFPNEENRLVYGYTSAGAAFTSKAGSTVTIYSDSGATTLADIRTEAGGAVPGSVLTVAADGRIPRFQGPDGTPYGVDTLYAVVQGSASIETVYARYDDRLDGLGVPITCTSGTRPNPPVDQMLIWETDTHRLMQYDLANTQWVPLADTAAWTAWSPSITQSVALTVTSNCVYKKIGRVVHIKGQCIYSSGAAVGGNAVLIGNLPFPIASTNPSFGHVGSGSIFDASAADDITGFLRQDATNQRLALLSSRANGTLGVVSFAAALAANDQINFQGKYESTV